MKCWGKRARFIERKVTIAARSKSVTVQMTTVLMGGTFRVEALSRFTRSEAATVSDLWEGDLSLRWTHQNRLFAEATLNVDRTPSRTEAHLPVSVGLDFRPARYLLGRLRYTGADLLHAGTDRVSVEASSSGAPGNATISALYAVDVDHDGAEGQDFNVTFRRWF